MKLSEAIRLGEFALPPVKGAWFRYRTLSGDICGGCAVGRMVWAAGYRPQALTLRERAKQFRTYGHVSDYNLAAIMQFVSAQWPWTVQYTEQWRGSYATLYFSDFFPDTWNQVVQDISEAYERHDTSMTVLAARIETLESIYDNPAAPDAAPHGAGLALQLEAQ